MARKEKQRAKAERRALRKAAPPIPYDEQIEMPASPPEDIPPGAPEQV